jgi:hypothetical protein
VREGEKEPINAVVVGHRDVDTASLVRKFVDQVVMRNNLTGKLARVEIGHPCEGLKAEDDRRMGNRNC